MKYYLLFLGVLAAAAAQNKYPEPVPILKQINRHNEDGSYSYGYEGADGSYKIESKYPNGEVFGKYGYVDDSGKLREIEYGASRRGFEPQGNDINVAPPTISNNYPVKPLGPNEEDDGQYREDPSIYYKDEKFNNNPPQQPLFKHSFNNLNQQPYYQQPTYPSYQQSSYQQPSYQQPTYQQPSYPSYQQPAYEPSYQQPAFRPTTKFSFDDFISNRPQSAPDFQPSYYSPAPAPYTQNYGGSHFTPGLPAANVNLDLGSYTVNYKRR